MEFSSPCFLDSPYHRLGEKNVSGYGFVMQLCCRCEFKTSLFMLVSSPAVRGKVPQQPADGRGVSSGTIRFPSTIMVTVDVEVEYEYYINK